MRAYLINLSVIVGLAFRSGPAQAGERGYRAEPSISKIEARRRPAPIVTRRVFGQIADLILTTQSFRASNDEPPPEPPLTQADRAALLDSLFAIVQAQPNADPMRAQPQLDDASVRRTLADLGAIVTIWPDPFISPHPTTQLQQMEFETRS